MKHTDRMIEAWHQQTHLSPSHATRLVAPHLRPAPPPPAMPRVRRATRCARSVRPAMVTTPWSSRVAPPRSEAARALAAAPSRARSWSSASRCWASLPSPLLLLCAAVRPPRGRGGDEREHPTGFGDVPALSSSGCLAQTTDQEDEEARTKTVPRVQERGYLHHGLRALWVDGMWLSS